jgi:hypothetical protein
MVDFSNFQTIYKDKHWKQKRFFKAVTDHIPPLIFDLTKIATKALTTNGLVLTSK